MSASIPFDTLEFNNTLREAGFDEKQALALTKAHAKASEQIHRDADYVSRTELKTDIQELRQDMQRLETGLKGEIAGVKAEITDIKADLKITKIMLALLVAGVGAIFMKLFFPH